MRIFSLKRIAYFDELENDPAMQEAIRKSPNGLLSEWVLNPVDSEGNWDKSIVKGAAAMETSINSHLFTSGGAGYFHIHDEGEEDKTQVYINTKNEGVWDRHALSNSGDHYYYNKKYDFMFFSEPDDGELYTNQSMLNAVLVQISEELATGKKMLKKC